MTTEARQVPPNRALEAPEAAITPQAGVEAVRARKLTQIPRKYQRLYLRAWTGQSRKSAIRAHCLECMGYQSGEVPRCTAPGCALYPYREGG